MPVSRVLDARPTTSHRYRSNLIRRSGRGRIRSPRSNPPTSFKIPGPLTMRRRRLVNNARILQRNPPCSGEHVSKREKCMEDVTIAPTTLTSTVNDCRQQSHRICSLHLRKRQKATAWKCAATWLFAMKESEGAGGGRAFFSLSASKEPYITIIWYVVRRYFTLNDREVISQ